MELFILACTPTPESRRPALESGFGLELLLISSTLLLAQAILSAVALRSSEAKPVRLFVALGFAVVAIVILVLLPSKCGSNSEPLIRMLVYPCVLAAGTGVSKVHKGVFGILLAITVIAIAVQASLP